MRTVPKSDNSLVRITTAARRIGISRQRVYVAIAGGRLRARDFDGVIYVHADDVERYRTERRARLEGAAAAAIKSA